MGSAALIVEDVGKCFHIYRRPRDRLYQLFRRARGERLYREFWALRHASFELEPGGALAIVGRNGSGKSTLLQIVAGTLLPSEGRVRIAGRVAALLELGSGFNVEFTGRENVYMNASILGLSRAEIDRRFDEIVRFADIGDFLDQPVKTYSSGMMVRLAFAVVSHIQADVLIIDEALAVGDEGFQRKCYGWLERFRAAGGTLLFVTHDAQSVVRLCERALLLDQGAILAHGASKAVVDVYQKLLYGSPPQARALRAALAQAGGRADDVKLDDGAPAPPGATQDPGPADEDPLPEDDAGGAYFDAALLTPPETTYGTGEAEILDVGTYDERGRRANVLVAGRPCELRYRVRFVAPAAGVRFGMMVKTTDGVDVAGVSSVHVGDRLTRAEQGDLYDVRFSLRLNLAPGTYFLNCGVSAMHDGEETYLHRRVDVAAVRVAACDEREIYGLAFLAPRMTVSPAGRVAVN